MTKCPQCGAQLSPDAPEGLCPACLLQRGIATEGGAPPFVPPPMAELAGLFPQLEILGPIGKGGMGAVYKARQPALDRVVALKILAPRTGSDLDFAGRFTREARALAKLSHPNIVAVYDFGQTGDLNYFIMEYVDGPNLRQLEQAGRLAPREALQIIPQICAALQFAHDEGIVHRDIKPENVLLDKKGRVKIADFGLAKILGPDPKEQRLTGAKDVVGTPHYMAPEQIEKPMEVDHRADIYSLGVVFYEMLTGELPLGRFQPPSYAPGVQVDVRLDEVVLRALAKEPERRYQQASVLQTHVETIAANPSSPETWLAHGRKKIMKNKSLWFGLGLGTACLIGLALWLLLMPRANSAQLSQTGWQQWQERRFNEALVSFSQAVKADDKNVEAWNGLGWAAFNTGRRAEAVEAFQKVISLQPDHAAALNGLGQICLAEKKFDEAEKYLLQAAPHATAAWFGLARLYLLQGKFAEAEEWAGKLVEIGQADEFGKQMLQAAKDKRVSETLRRQISP